ncbi:MAG TPA: glycerol-3-phosphate dehydrogenase [Bauldia sp.]
MAEPAFDLAIIGGGINGCGVARDAAGRGLKVVLVEQGDLGGATSSASTKLIHGGLRYLEQYDFRLVREALAEREVLLHTAPHIVWPQRFVLPHHSGMRPWPIVRLGLFAYDHLSLGRTLPGTRGLDLANDPAGVGLKKSYRRAFEFSDCAVDDSRLVVLCARDAADRGAEIRPRTRCIAARREDNLWRLTLHNNRDATQYETVTARALVNAAGPWVDEVAAGIAQLPERTTVRLVKGSHIVVDRLFDHDRAYLFQNGDGRVCFAIPYRTDFTLIGTTDEDFSGDPASAAITDSETDYLLAAVSEYMERPLSRTMIRWSYAGVRPLQDEGSGRPQQVTRDYLLAFDATEGSAPVLSVYGGKITTHRRLAEQVLEQLAPGFPDMTAAWTAHSALPGGDVPGAFDEWAETMVARYAFLDRDRALRLCRAYGTRVATLLDGVTDAAGLGREFGAGLSEREVDYLVAHEWAETADDILWRRTKLGLRLTPDEVGALDRHLDKVPA